jgi:hypothetical protein
MTSSSRPDTEREPARAVADALTAAGVAADRLTPLLGGYGGGTFRATTQLGELVVKERSDVRPPVHGRWAQLGRSAAWS